jgi:hypothetical protein
MARERPGAEEAARGAGGVIEAVRLDTPHSRAPAFRAQLYADGSFEWTPDGELVNAVAVPGIGGIMDDIAAWRPSDPCRWWLRRQIAVILGLEAVEIADWTHEPLRLLETPFDWIEAEGKGAVILRWDAPLRLYLPQRSKIKCQSERLAHKLKAALAPPRDEYRVEVADG